MQLQYPSKSDLTDFPIINENKGEWRVRDSTFAGLIKKKQNLTQVPTIITWNSEGQSQEEMLHCVLVTTHIHL